MNTRRCYDFTSLELAHLYFWVATQSSNSELCLNVLVFLPENSVPSFFEHHKRFLCYSAALCMQINMFQSKGHALNASILRVFVNFK